MKKQLLFVLLSVCSLQVFAQISLVKDICTTPTIASSGNPMHMTVYKSQLYFSATDTPSSFHPRMWQCDTNNVTTKLNAPWPAGSARFVWVEPFPYENFAVAGGKLFFTGEVSSFSGYWLHSFDGSSVVVVNDSVDSPEYITEMGGKIYFGGGTHAYGSELWQYDPGSGISTRLSDINAGVGGSDPQYLTVYNNKLYFAATNPAIGTELYVYDPGSGNISLVQDINTGAASSQPWNLTVYNGKLYFSAITATYGNELYSYNGTTVTRLTDFGSGSGDGIYQYTGSGGFFGRGVFGYKGAIYFAGAKSSTYVLSKYDTVTGTAAWVYDCVKPHDFIVYKNKMYFSASHATNTGQLWYYDTGSTATSAYDKFGGVHLVAAPYNFVQFNNYLYFRSSDSTHGVELFRFYDTTTNSGGDTNVNHAGVQNVLFTGEVKAYPNPAKTEFQIDIVLKNAEQLSVILFDVSGKEIFRTDKYCEANKSSFIIPIRQLQAGTYFYQLFNRAGTLYYTSKVLKE